MQTDAFGVPVVMFGATRVALLRVSVLVASPMVVRPPVVTAMTVAELLLSNKKNDASV